MTPSQLFFSHHRLLISCVWRYVKLQEVFFFHMHTSFWMQTPFWFFFFTKSSNMSVEPFFITFSTSCVCAFLDFLLTYIESALFVYFLSICFLLFPWSHCSTLNRLNVRLWTNVNATVSLELEVRQGCGIRYCEINITDYINKFMNRVESILQHVFHFIYWNFIYCNVLRTRLPAAPLFTTGQNKWNLFVISHSRVAWWCSG